MVLACCTRVGGASQNAWSKIASRSALQPFCVTTLPMATSSSSRSWRATKGFAFSTPPRHALQYLVSLQLEQPTPQGALGQGKAGPYIAIQHVKHQAIVRIVHESRLQISDLISTVPQRYAAELPGASRSGQSPRATASLVSLTQLFSSARCWSKVSLRGIHQSSTRSLCTTTVTRSARVAIVAERWWGAVTNCEVVFHSTPYCTSYTAPPQYS